LRRDGGGLLDRLLKPALDKAGAPVPTPIEIVSLEPLSLLAIRNTGAYSELNRGYEALFGAVFSVLPMEALRGIWGRWHEDPRFTEADQLHFDCAIAVERDEGFTPAPPVVELPAAGGRYARLRHVGDYESLHDSIDRLYAAMIEREDVEIADAPLLVNYVDDPEGKAPETLRSDIYLAVASAG
jgi:AraC family transcriptional regulator